MTGQHGTVWELQARHVRYFAHDAVGHGLVQYIYAVRCGTVRYVRDGAVGTVQHRTRRPGAVRYGAGRHGRIRYRTARSGTVSSDTVYTYGAVRVAEVDKFA